uniref:Uncharacterized protein n=1 Tax=Rousettus aegyptiacus TaxID=9407 RepID=A0A7J8F065_ROUAE|nr:hypothetical protein HJG63_012235 [Rousettus aegyptiacus]
MSMCSELLPRRLCFSLLGLKSSSWKLGSHINSSSTCQQPPSSSDVTFSSPEMTQGFREQKASAHRIFHTMTVRALPRTISILLLGLPSLTLPQFPGSLFPFREEKLEGHGKACYPGKRWGN